MTARLTESRGGPCPPPPEPSALRVCAVWRLLCCSLVHSAIDCGVGVAHKGASSDILRRETRVIVWPCRQVSPQVAVSVRTRHAWGQPSPSRGARDCLCAALCHQLSSPGEDWALVCHQS